MKKSNNISLTLGLMLFLVVIILTGCGGTKNINMNDDQGGAVMGLDYRDFEQASSDAIASMIQSGAVSKPGGGRFVMAISRIVNDTMQRIDTDQLIKKIRVILLQSGKVSITTAVSHGGPEDGMSDQARKLRNNDEFRQDTVARKGQMVAPDLSLSGKIIQRNVKYDRSTQQVEYYFQLTLTEIATGLSIWEGETVIGKRGNSKAVSW